MSIPPPQAYRPSSVYLRLSSSPPSRVPQGQYVTVHKGPYPSQPYSYFLLEHSFLG